MLSSLYWRTLPTSVSPAISMNFCAMLEYFAARSDTETECSSERLSGRKYHMQASFGSSRKLRRDDRVAIAARDRLESTLVLCDREDSLMSLESLGRYEILERNWARGDGCRL